MTFEDIEIFYYIKMFTVNKYILSKRKKWAANVIEMQFLTLESEIFEISKFTEVLE